MNKTFDMFRGRGYNNKSEIDYNNANIKHTGLCGILCELFVRDIEGTDLLPESCADN